MDQEALQRITAQLSNGVEDTQAAQAVFDFLDQHELDESSEMGEQLLTTIASSTGVIFHLIQLVIDQNRLEDYWNFLLQAIDRLPASDEQQSLENAILELWLSPLDAKSYANLGLAWASLRQPEHAEAAYNRAAAIDPDSAYIYNDRGVMFYNHGDYTLALRDYTKALAIDPNDPVTLKNKIIALGDLNRFEEAGEILASYLSQNPSDVWAIHERGRGKAELGDYAGAIEDYDLSLSLDRSYKWAYLNKGSALINLDRYEEALNPLNEAITLDPANIRALHERGRAFSLQDRYEEAIVDYDRVIALDPTYKWAYGNKAYALRELERYAESEETFLAVLDLDPAYVWAHKEFGVLYEKMGKTEQAIREYDLAIAVDPDYKFAHANKGNLLRSLKRYHEALKALDEAIRIDDNYKWAIHERGLAYFNLNQFETAIIDFEQVVALDPRYKWAYANIGKCAWELKRYEDAEKAFGAALDIDPNYNWVLRERGELYLYLQKYSDALMDFSQTIITEASTSEDYYDRARSYQKMGVALEKENRYDERQGVLRKARADLEEALKLEPGNPDYLWYLGVAWHDMYAYDRAEEIYLQAIENNKDQDSQDVAILWWNIAKSRNQWGLIVKDPEQHQKSVAALALAKLKLSDPIQSAECLGDQGQAYLALNDYVQAIKVLSHACTLDPANAQLLYLKGKAEYLMGDIQGAEETFAAVLDLKSDPSNYGPSAWVGRGLCAEAQNKSKQAEEAFKQALGENKETAGAFLGRADAFEGLQAFARSAEDLEKAIELEPENANALNSLSWLYAEKLPTPENLTRAIQYGERAIKSQVEFFWRCNYLDTLGWACYKAGKYGEAVKYIIEALNSLPEPFEIRYHREQAEDAIHAQGERS